MMRWLLLQRLGLSILALPPLFGLAACETDIKVVPTPTNVQAIFDPTDNPCSENTECTSGVCRLNPTSGQKQCAPAIPTPTDLAVDQGTGLLAVPVADDKENPAQAYFDAFLNTLNGYPTSVTAEMRFSGELDPATVSKDTILVLEATDPTKPLADLVFEHKLADGKSMVRIWNYAGWKRGTTYIIYVIGGEKGIKDKGGKPIIRSALFELAAAKNPLCAWDAARYVDPDNGACVDTPLRGGVPLAKGCCTYNYSALLESSVKAVVRKAMEGKPTEEVEVAVKQAVLAKATSFERLRQGYGLLLNLFGLFTKATALPVEEKDVALLFNFTTVGLNEAVFDPSASIPRLPKPTDLAKNPATGLLVVPSSPTASDAEKELNAYLSSLDGYPAPTSAAVLEFTGELDAATVDAARFGVFEIGATGLTEVADVTATYDPAKGRVVIAPKGGFAKRGATYAVFARAGEGGLENKEKTPAQSPRRSALMHLVLSPYPLCTFDAATKACTDAKISSFIDDPADKTGGLTGLQKATRFEMIRQGYDALLKLYEATSQKKRGEVISLWTFSITSMSEALFDPTVGVLPFPNNLLLDPVKATQNPPVYQVAIPATPGETPGAKALREGLNTLDGFTTQGSYYAPYAGKIDPASLVAGTSAIIANLTTIGKVTKMNFNLVETAPAVVGTPAEPLDEKSIYAVVLVSKFKEGEAKADGGLTDDKGRRVVPSTFMSLLRNRHPLLENGKSTIPSLVDDAKAAVLEPLRLQHKPLFDLLEMAMGVKREDIVVAWTFRTQSITEPLTQLRTLPWLILGTAVDSNQPIVQGTYTTDLSGFPADLDDAKYKDSLAGWVPNGVFLSWNALDETGTGAFKPDPTKGAVASIPFILTVPQGAMPAQGWPVVIFQHGLHQGAQDALYLANTFAKQGLATVAFDVIYHGLRTWCLKNGDCKTGGTCTVATGVCDNGLLDTNGDGKPDASGDRFLNAANPFALRDNMRQHVIDAAALLRSIKLKGGQDFFSAPQGVQLDATKVSYVGQSLGSILGTLVLAVDRLPTRGVLSVPGAPFVNIALTSPHFQYLKDAVLKAQNVTEGSLDYLKLATIFNWVLDPADPGNFAKHVKTVPLDDRVAGGKVPLKEVIIQLGDKDDTIPKPLGDYLAAAMGVDTTKTVYANQKHSFLLKPDPDANATAAAQLQAVQFLTQGDVCTPNLTDGTCPLP